VLLSTWNGTAASDDAEALAAALGRLAVALFEHMGLEEKPVLPLVERHIFASEWEKMVEDRPGLSRGPARSAGPMLKTSPP